MFSKETNHCPSRIIKYTKACFGVYDSSPDKIDISGIVGPFTGLPLPAFITDTRIKSTLSFAFNLEKYIGVVEFFDAKISGTAEVVFWDKETGQKYSYHTLMWPRRSFVPHNAAEAVCASYRRSRFIKIFWSTKINRFSLNFSVGGDKARPSAKCIFHAEFLQKLQHQLLTVSPAPTVRRCSASWIVPFEGTGGLSLSKRRKNIKWVEETPGLSMLMMNSVYATFRTITCSAYSLAEIDGRKIFFHFANSSYDAVDNDSYNDNVLFADNEMTLMPSVVISNTFGMNDKWVIQDTESMVDLVFSPKSTENHTADLLIFRNQYSLIYGTFEGVLLTKDGKKIEIKNCPGIVKKNLLRS